MSDFKTADRLNYSVQAKELLDKIEESNFLGLANRGGAGLGRSDMFLFAMALGVESNVGIEIKKLYSGGLVRDENINAKTKAAIYSYFISQLSDPENKLDEIENKWEVYKLAESYANSGFEYIEEYYETKTPDNLALDLLSELQKQYEEIID